MVLFSWNPTPLPGVAAKVWPHRFTSVLLLSVVVLAATIIGRPRDESGAYPERFWIEKAHWQAIADVVLAGDSRVYRGLSPAEMARHLAGVRIFNFGFSSAGYSPDYLAAIEQVLDPASSRKAIILGITPFSLTPSASRNNGFMENRNRRATGLFDRVLEPLFWHLEPMGVGGLVNLIRQHHHYYEMFHANGWVAGRRVPEVPGDAVDRYGRVFLGNAVAPSIEDGLLFQVRQWADAGVRVYGFRPPTCRKMVDLENERSGFAEKTFVVRFEAEGGIWLNLDQTAYHTYDGSHLREDAAVELSGDVARLMRPRLVSAGK
jgi:hypothetical protein